MCRLPNQQDGEFVATQAGNPVAFPQASFQPLGGESQDLVAQSVTQRIVHLLEVIQIDAQQ